MERKKTQSSNIASVGYDEEKKILEIGFKSGGVYQYTNVGPTVYDTFIKAESLGKYFHQYIKGTFTCSKIETTDNLAGERLKHIITRNQDGEEVIFVATLRNSLKKWINIYSQGEDRKKEEREGIISFIKYFLGD